MVPQARLIVSLGENGILLAGAGGELAPQVSPAGTDLTCVLFGPQTC